MVKLRFRRWAQEDRGELLHRKPIRPGEAEIRQNPGSRSAKLRAIEKRGPQEGPQGEKYGTKSQEG